MKLIIFSLITFALSSACMTSALAPSVTHRAPQATAGHAFAPTATLDFDTVKLCGNANIRASASADGASYGWRYKGEIVRVYEVSKGWLRVGARQWIIAVVACN